MKQRSRGWAGSALLAGVIIALAAVSGCDREAAPAGGVASAAARAAPASAVASAAVGTVSVSTVRAVTRDVDVMLEATGTISALNSVDIRPQVSSVITRVNIREGQYVKAGQALFTLDARNDEVNLAKAKAQLERDLASLADAQRQLARGRDLLAQGFISQGAVDTNQTAVDTQQAVVTADRAAIQAAQVGLSYNLIVAPSAGRAGAINVYPGSTVQPGAGALVTITQLDPIAVSFSLPQRHLEEVLQTMRSGGGKVVALLPESRDQLVGKLHFVDNVVDANSGTVKVKAVFDNAGEKLWPGAFVNVRLAVNTLKGAIVVPHAAVIRGPRGTLVYTVDANQKAAARPVELLHAAGLDAAVRGIEPGERVVVDGRHNLRAGVPVVERAAPSAGAASGAGATTP